MKQFEEQRTKLLGGVWSMKGAFLAGGAVNSVFTGRNIADYDFYFRDAKAFSEAVESAYDDGYWCVNVSNRSVTFSDNGTLHQYMHFEFFEDASRVFDAFYFTICMGAYDFEKGDFVLHDRFLTDCAERKLRFHAGTRFPAISALRVLKYQQRGYTIEREDMLQLALACADLKLNSWEDLEVQIGGIYGDRTAVARNGDFSLRKAIAAIAEQSSDPRAAREKSDKECPATAEALLERLGYAKQASTDAPELTEA